MSRDVKFCKRVFPFSSKSSVKSVKFELCTNLPLPQFSQDEHDVCNDDETHGSNLEMEPARQPLLEQEPLDQVTSPQLRKSIRVRQIRNYLDVVRQIPNYLDA